MKKGYYYREVGCNDFNGPFPTIAKAEKAIEQEHKAIWESSCNCLQRDTKDKWCNPVEIFQIVKRVELQITANVKLVES